MEVSYNNLEQGIILITELEMSNISMVLILSVTTPTHT